MQYRPAKVLQSQGEYLYINNGVEFYRRDYHTTTKEVAKQRVRVIFDDARISRIVDIERNQTVAMFSLEPYLLDRLQASNLEDRILIKLAEMPELMQQTLLLIEDRDFYQHHGVSPLAIIRALWSNIKAGKTVQGGSTLTQQLAKNMFLNRDRTIIRKINEAFIAVLLDAQYSKDEIFEAYINEVYLGQNFNRAVHGFGLASRFYFGKTLYELEPHEMAVLIAMVKGPSYYNPRSQSERTQNRRDLVLRLMVENNLLSAQQYEYAVSQPIAVMSKDKVLARRFPSYLAQVRHELKRILSADIDLHSGVQVFTYFDPFEQNRAQAAISQTLTQLEQQPKVTNLQAAMVLVDTEHAGISAMVGDRRANYDGFNRALNAERNIGSLVKPAIYLAALEDPMQYRLATLLKDEPITLGNNGGQKWSPKNYDNKFKGRVNMLDALSQSRNIPTVNLGMEVGLDTVTDSLRRLGIKGPIPQYPSMLLGSLTLSPLDVAQMYQPIANAGFKRDLHAIAAIKHQNQTIWKARGKSDLAIHYEYTYLLNYALHQSTQTGTARWLGNMYTKTNFAGKTGTTNDSRDSWFVGYDQTQLGVIWIGRDDNQPIHLTGSSGALRAYGAYQAKRKPVSLVTPRPNEVDLLYFDTTTGQQVTPGCQNVRLIPVIAGTAPAIVECEWAVEPEPTPQKNWFERFLGL